MMTESTPAEQKALSVAVLGPGGVGGFLTALFCRQGLDVTCVARPATAEVIARRGLELDSPALGRFKAAPKVVTRLTEPVDLLVVATKAGQLAEAVTQLSADLSATVVLPLLNGIEHVEFLRRQLRATVLSGSIRISARVVEPGRIVQFSDFAIVSLASDDPAKRQEVTRLARFLEECGVKAVVVASERQVLWEKLVRLNALACTTAASDRTIGWIRQDPAWRKTLMAVVEEGARIARAEGVGIETEKEMDILDGLPAALTSSMRDDLAAGRPSELDAIAGAVVRAGKNHGLASPVTENLIASILLKWQAQIR